jgi:glycosyltransferase involved in cell wall biosynthesis
MISVVIPAFNAGQFISRTINSVLAQTYTDYEIIVVDDGSSDNTADVVKSYGSKIRYIHQENAGTTAARNTGIKAAVGDWIAFLDHDDEWLPQKLQLQQDLLRSNPMLVWATGNYYRCLCEENRRATDCIPRKIERLQKGKGYFDSYFSAFTSGAWGHTDTMLIKRQVLEEAGLFRVGQLWAEDLDMWFRIACRWPAIGYVSQPIARHHRTKDTLLRKYKPVQAFSDVISRNIAISAEQKRLDEFKPCAALLVRSVIRSMLFDGRAEDIRCMMGQFDELLPKSYKLYMRLLTSFPGTTAAGCHTISRIVRFLHLRHKLDVRPMRRIQGGFVRV